MKCLTVVQPSAHMIVTGQKDVENRSWPTSYRGRLLIHSHRVYNHEVAGWMEESLGVNLPADLPLGAIVGSVELVDVVENDDSPWAFEDHYHWVVVDEVEFFKPIPWTGQQRLFDVPEWIVARAQAK